MSRKKLGDELLPVDTIVPHRGQSRRQVALGQAASVLVSHQCVVQVGRLGQAEQVLEQALRGRRRTKIGPANDGCDSTCRIVDDAG